MVSSGDKAMVLCDPTWQLCGAAGLWRCVATREIEEER